MSGIERPVALRRLRRQRRRVCAAAVCGLQS
jgi:hypothetical protein